MAAGEGVQRGHGVVEEQLLLEQWEQRESAGGKHQRIGLFHHLPPHSEILQHLCERSASTVTSALAFPHLMMHYAGALMTCQHLAVHPNRLDSWTGRSGKGATASFRHVQEPGGRQGGGA